MQLPKTTVPAPSAPSAPPAVSPAPAQKQPGRKGLWILLVLAVAAGAGYLAYTGNQEQSAQDTTAVAFRTHTVQQAGVQKTLRLTGTTAAERYSSLLTPQLRGSRSGFGRDGQSFRSGGSRGSSGGSSSGGSDRGSSGGGSSSGGSGGSSVSSSSGGGASAGDGSSGGGSSTQGAQSQAGGGLQASRGATAMRSATSRISAPRASSNRNAQAAANAAASATMGAEGLGQTSGLPGGSGGGSPGGGGGGFSGRGGGGSEFMLVLQDGAKAGVVVKKGDSVAEFDRQYMLTRLDDYKAGVAQSEASFRKMEAELEVSKEAHNQTVEVAKADLDKAKLDMKTLPVLSAMDAERRRLTLEEAQARHNQISQEVKFVDAGIRADRRVAEIQLKQSQLELKRNEANVDRMVMKAPIDGLVVYQTVFRGSEFDQIKVGDQLFPGQMFMQIVDPSSMVINANVSQVDVEKLRIGMKARVRFDAFPDLELPARVYAVASVAKSGRYRPDWVKDLGVVLKIEKMDRRVIPDLSVSCDVILDSSDSAVVAPLEGVFHDGDAPKPGTPAYVFVRAANGVWQRRQVELGVANFTHVAIAKGLAANEVIALEKPPSKEAGPPNVS